MYKNEKGESTTAMPIVTDIVVQQDTSQSYISIHDAVELVCKARRMKPIEGVFTDTFSWAISFVNSVPSVKLTRKKRKWIEHDTGHSIYFDCSLCGCLAPCTETADEILWKMANYCPDCGSYNGGGNNGNE